MSSTSGKDFQWNFQIYGGLRLCGFDEMVVRQEKMLMMLPILLLHDIGASSDLSFFVFTYSSILASPEMPVTLSLNAWACLSLNFPSLLTFFAINCHV